MLTRSLRRSRRSATRRLLGGSTARRFGARRRAMVRRLLLTGIIALAGGSALSAQTQTQTTRIETVAGGAVEIDKTTQTEDVRFRNDGNDRLTVPVRLAGTGPYRF